VVREGQLLVNQERYPCLILPMAEYLVKEAADFIVDGAAKGLKVFAVDRAPVYDAKGCPLSQEFRAAVEVVSLENLAEKVKECAVMEVRVKDSNPGLRRITFRKEDALVTMFFHEGLTDEINTLVSVRDTRYNAVTVYDPWTDRRETFAMEKGVFPLHMLPGEAVFWIMEESIEVHRHYPVKREAYRIVTDWIVSRKAVGRDVAFSGESFGDMLLIKAGEPLPNLNGPEYYPSFTGTYRYEGEFDLEEKLDLEEEAGGDFYLLLPEVSDSVHIRLNDMDLGYMAGFPGRIYIGDALKQGRNKLVMEVTTTLVWERKDGASTHLQIPASGITKDPFIVSLQNGNSYGGVI